MRKVIPLGIGLALCSTLAMAQTPFKGKVLDENGEPVIGASLLVVGTNRGTITDIDGSFTLTAPEGSGQIKVSYVGMVSQIVGIKPNLKITLKSDSQNLDEVVVIAYGTTSSKNLTGAVSSVRGEAIKNLPGPSVDEML